MAILTLRLVKGTPLTNQEVDDNFSNLNSDINTLYAQVSTSANITGGNIIGLANLASSGNVYGNYFLGNGSLLTGISVDSPRILFGNTAVVIVGNNGAISANINNTSVMTIDKDGEVTKREVYVKKIDSFFVEGLENDQYKRFSRNKIFEFTLVNDKFYFDE
jgi:hypothetical protein